MYLNYIVSIPMIINPIYLFEFTQSQFQRNEFCFSFLFRSISSIKQIISNTNLFLYFLY